MAYRKHTRFYYTELLTCLSYDCGSFSDISGIDMGGNVYRQVRN